MSSTIRTIIILTALGVAAYFMAFFRVFDVHDYYLITIFCLPILLFIAISDIIEKKQWMVKKTYQFTIGTFIIILFGYAAYKSAYEQNYRYFGKDYNTFNKDYYDVEPYLRSIGIKRDDLVVSVPDQSPNVTLYLMNQIGFTECYNTESFNINHFVYGEGAKYLIIADSSYLHNPLYQPFCKAENKIGEYKSISIYKTH
jgi:hypothetical protein